VVTVSDTRTLETDESGKEAERLLIAGGHRSAGRAVVPDDPTAIAGALRDRLADPAIDAVLLTGGTGVSRRDVTPEVVRSFLDLELPGFGELFRTLSHGRIGSAALLSRALGGIAAGKPLFCLPGSRAAVVLALEELILPELGHLVGELRK
jgi:molybdenum cofactor biosynthesis protein B